MCCNVKQVASRLHKELQFEEGTALAWARTCGRCEYCGRDLVTDRLGYAAGEIDHILPMNIYEDMCEKPFENRALSCSLCNGIKRDFDPRKEEEDPYEMITEKREELVTRCREEIAKKRTGHDKRWRLAKQIILGISQSLPEMP